MEASYAYTRIHEAHRHSDGTGISITLKGGRREAVPTSYYYQREWRSGDTPGGLRCSPHVIRHRPLIPPPRGP